jgi:hypothetical protein
VVDFGLRDLSGTHSSHHHTPRALRGRDRLTLAAPAADRQHGKEHDKAESWISATPSEHREQRSRLSLLCVRLFPAFHALAHITRRSESRHAGLIW